MAVDNNINYTPSGTGHIHAVGDVDDQGVAVQREYVTPTGSQQSGSNKLIIDSHGSQQALLYGSDGNVLATNPTDAFAPTRFLAAAPIRFNGTNWDRWYNSNDPIVVLASAARTATTTGTFVNYNWPGMIVALNVTSVTSTPSLQVGVLGGAFGGGFIMPLTTALAPPVAGNAYYYLYAPGASATPYAAANGVEQQFATGIPGGTITIQIVHNNANSVTYAMSVTPVTFS